MRGLRVIFAGGAAAILAAQGCSAIFGFEDGIPESFKGAGGGSSGAGGATSTSSSSSSSGSSSASSSGTSGAGGTSTTSSSSGGTSTSSSSSSNSSTTSSSSSGGCQADEKACGPTCAKLTDPAFGCAAPSCAPCAFANATAQCTAGACAFLSCNANYATCDGNPGNGCEANTQTDAKHCGNCGTSCAANQICAGGVCGCIVEVTRGGFHACARKGDGTLWCWGDNEQGELGDGTIATPKPSPVQVTALGADVVEVAAGGYHTCARKTDGTLWCWGGNAYGQVTGDASMVTPQPSPVQVTALGANVVQVSSARLVTCVRKGDGTLWCWGENNYGQLGDGTIATPKPSPVQVAALGANVVQVSVGQYHTCACKGDGTLWCWGANDNGQVGDGTTASPKASPVQVMALGVNVVEVSAGAYHTCARKADGTLWCWGENTWGQVTGDGSAVAPQPSPVQVTALGTTVVQVAVGDGYTCARKSDGTLWCWGNNIQGELGDGTKVAKATPVQVTAFGASVVQVAAGAYGSFFTCARKGDGTLSCWGDNTYGQVGDGTLATPKPSPVTVLLTCP